MKSYLYIILIVCIFVSCKKATDRQCLKSTGDEETMLILLNEDFDTLDLYDGIVYNLVQDTINELEISGGKNLIPFVSSNISNNKLIIRNENNCNFLRSLNKKIRVNIHYKDLSYINFKGSESLESSNVINTNSLRIRIRDNAGSVNLNVSVGYLETSIVTGYGDYNLSGSAQTAYLNCNSNGFCDARALTTSQNLIVRSNTQGNMYINAGQVNLEATILQAGNIKYTGTPITKDVNISGEGQLIDLED